MGVWVGVQVGVEFWDTDPLFTAGVLTKIPSSLGEEWARAGDGGFGGDVKRCGGQLGVLRGGTGGKEVSEVGETRRLECESTGVLWRNLVLSLGTGFSLSPSIPPFLSSSFPPPGIVCLCPGTGFFSPPLSSFTLDTCLSLGTGFSLSLGVGLDVAPLLFSLSLRTGFSSAGIGTCLSLCNTLAFTFSSNL